MSRSFLNTLAVSIAGVLLPGAIAVAGGWSDEVPITQDELYQYHHYVTVAPDDSLYVLWPDWTDSEDTQVLLTKSSDRGQTWSQPAVIFSGSAYEYFALQADEVGLHVLLLEYVEDDEGESKHVLYAFSDDGGETFSEPVPVGARASVEEIELRTGGGTIYVYAQDYDFDTEIAYHFLYASSDGGENWTENEIMPGQVIRNPEFAVDANGVHLAFASMPNEPNVEIQYARSVDAGETWTTLVSVSHGAGAYSQLPSIVTDGATIHVAWEDNREDYYNILYARSTDGGQTWSEDVRLNDTFYGARPQLLKDEEGLHVLWCQYHGDDGWPSTWFSGDYGIIRQRASTDDGLTWSGEFRVSQNEDIPPANLPTLGANYVRVAEFSTGFCAVWQDKRDGNIDLYLRDYAGLAGAGDMNCDGAVDFADINPFVAALVQGEAAYEALYPGCLYMNADICGNGSVGFDDINPFVDLLLGK